MVPGKRGKILIVEDDLLLSMVTERHVKNLGLEVIGKVVSGEEAIQKAFELQPDVIIMDISLRGKMTGIEAMNEIRKGSDVSVIYLSGSTGTALKAEAQATSFSFYLTKPVTRDELKFPLLKALNQSPLESAPGE